MYRGVENFGERVRNGLCAHYMDCGQREPGLEHSARPLIARSVS